MSSFSANAARPSGHRVAGANPSAPGPPGGIFASGTKVQVGQSRVVVDRYLSEGGFAHVYLVTLPKPIAGEDKAVLKRVAVPDKEALANMRTEIDTMKKLRGHRQIVTYFDSHASQLQGGGYEVFVLMEYCQGGGLIDFMNTRLQNRLTEPEILKIVSDTAQGVAAMHYLKPPLLHRDLKVENILISTTSGSKQFKLCDFGSAAPPRPAATSAAEGRLIEEDVQRHTTMQYRSPEMVDVYRKQPIDEKSDIWALGVFLYKLCYYTTPFEEQGQMAILNATFRYPGYPQFSDRLKRMIAMMLQEKPTRRPNIYQVVCEICSMRGTDVPIKDIYAGRTVSEARRNQELPPPPGQVASPPTVGAMKVIPTEEKPAIPEITPMRRGRPTKNASEQLGPKSSPSPRRPVSSDPFAALDSNGANSTANDELSSRFPTLDQFSLLHDSRGTFSFDAPPAPAQVSPQPKELSQRVTEALADDAFASSSTLKSSQAPQPAAAAPSTSIMKTTGTQTSPEASRSSTSLPSKSHMISTGTMTSTSSDDPGSYTGPSSSSLRPVFRFPPSDQRSSSQPRQTAPLSRQDSATGKDGLSPRPLQTRSHSQTNLMPKTSPSLRASDSTQSSTLEPDGQQETGLSRVKSRPVSGTLETATKFLHVRAGSRGISPDKRSSNPPSAELYRSVSNETPEESRIDSNVEFLRQMEEEDSANRKREKRLSSGSLKPGKRSSLPSISLSGTKNLLAGRFGEAFKRFETNTASGGDDEGEPSLRADNINLTPIAGSEATDGRSDDGHVLDESEEIPPEVRRELERRRLSQEEKRVAQAAAEYKQRVADGNSMPGKDGGARAAAIQNKVQALLDESAKPTASKTAEGYGRFTDSPKPIPPHITSQKLQQSQRSGPPATSGAAGINAATSNAGTLPSRTASLPTRSGGGSSVTPSNIANSPTTSRAGVGGPAPGPRPKPQALRAGGVGPAVASKPAALASAARTGPASSAAMTHSNAAVVAPAAGVAADGLDEDWEATFSKKYPSLAGLEMVETEIAGQGTGTGRYRDI